MIKHFILGYFALLQIGSLIETILRHNLPWSWFAVRPSMDNSEMRLFVWMTEALGAAKRFVPPCHFTLHTALTTDRPARGQGRGGAGRGGLLSSAPENNIYLHITKPRSHTIRQEVGSVGIGWYVSVVTVCIGWDVRVGSVRVAAAEDWHDQDTRWPEAESRGHAARGGGMLRIPSRVNWRKSRCVSEMLSIV